MAVTGTFATDHLVADYTEEAFERAGLSQLTLTQEHTLSIRRSMNFIFSSWATKGAFQWKFVQHTHTPTAIGETQFNLPEGTIGIETMVVRRQGTDTEMYAISRSDYLIIHDKNITDQLVMDLWVQINDAGSPTNTLDIPFRFQDAFAAELAKRIAQKYNGPRLADLKVEARDAFRDARGDDRDKSPMVLTVNYERTRGRR